MVVILLYTHEYTIRYCRPYAGGDLCSESKVDEFRTQIVRPTVILLVRLGPLIKKHRSSDVCVLSNVDYCAITIEKSFDVTNNHNFE